MTQVLFKKSLRFQSPPEPVRLSSVLIFNSLVVLSGTCTPFKGSSVFIGKHGDL